MSYTLTWLTRQLAVGSAPSSYEDLDAIAAQGIDAIVNLCGEFCDLHQIEQQSGFEVYYLPVADECAPDLERMEQALDWLDEALYLKKKILIHCRHGLGRTGTFVSAYLLRRGLGLKLTEKKLKSVRVSPGSYSQWQLLRKYGKQQGELEAREPTLEEKETVDLHPFFKEYAELLDEADSLMKARGGDPQALDAATICHDFFTMDLIEAVALSHALNRKLTREQRAAAMERACAWSCRLKQMAPTEEGDKQRAVMLQMAVTEPLSCPLLVDGARCLLHTHRPLRCRAGLEAEERERLRASVAECSRAVFLALTGVFPPAAELQFSIFDTISGRFVQQYFQAMLKEPQG